MQINLIASAMRVSCGAIEFEQIERTMEGAGDWSPIFSV
jgi:hypothetical protein